MEPLWGEPGEGGPRWCWKSFGELGWQSAEQRDWHYWCHKAILQSCKIQIFIHYVDPSDSDPRPRTTDILYKASAACTQLNKIWPASASTQSIQSTSDDSHSDKFSGKVLKLLVNGWSARQTSVPAVSQTQRKHMLRSTACTKLGSTRPAGLHAKTARCFGSSLKMFCGSSRLWGQSQVTLWKLKNRFGSS